tara:strand:+ start:191 stop:355 length:165 start_codon:yes stop_codon:yes gene_type:complete
MNPEDVEKYMDARHPLPHIEYHKNDPKIIIPKPKEETDEEPEGDSSGHPGPDDA